MPEKGGRTQVVVYCTECESVYTGFEWPDGQVRLIGREFCPCGSRDLAVLHSDRSSG